MKKQNLGDINQIAHSIAEKSTAEQEADLRHKAAAMLGRLGGLKGGRARADKLSPKRRRSIAQAAIKARWDKYRTEKLKKKRKTI